MHGAQEENLDRSMIGCTEKGILVQNIGVGDQRHNWNIKASTQELRRIEMFPRKN